MPCAVVESVDHPDEEGTILAVGSWTLSLSVHVVMFMIRLLVLPSVEGGPLDLALLAGFSRDQEAGAPSVLEGPGVVKVWRLTWRTYLMYQDG